MLEIVEGFPDNVVAVVAKGRVTRKDYEQVLIPRVADALKRHDKVALYYELGVQFSGIDPGAMLADLKIGIEHLTRWERMALVTDVDWIKHMVHAFGFVMPGQIRIFATAQAAEARAWILGAES